MAARRGTRVRPWRSLVGGRGHGQIWKDSGVAWSGVARWSGGACWTLASSHDSPVRSSCGSVVPVAPRARSPVSASASRTDTQMETVGAEGRIRRRYELSAILGYTL